MKTRTILLQLTAILIIMGGCAYYNTFFNAKKYFESAQSQQLREDGRPSSRAIQDYDRVIERCAIILTEYLDSRWADDALFLMGRAMYYKRTQYHLARDRFEELIKFYPESPHIPEAEMYIARILFFQGRKDEAYQRMNEFLRNTNFSSYMPQAHLLIADFALEERNYSLVRYHLSQIIENYPRSRFYNDAYFRLGISYFESARFDQSIEVFKGLVARRRMPRRLVLDSRYYISLNYLKMENYESSLETANRLIRDEFVVEKLPRIQIVRARAKIGLGKFAEANDVLTSVIQNNRRTAFSAEANFFLGEIYLLHLFDYGKAIEHYNNVRTEHSASPYVERAVSKSAIASLIMQFQEPDRAVPTNVLVEEQKKLAEYYLYDLALPDSAMVVYNNIVEQKSEIERSIHSVTDKILNYSALDDSVSIATADSLQSVKRSLEEDFTFYESEIIPETYFKKIWVYKNIYKDTDAYMRLYSTMEDEYPKNKYTHASYLLINDEPVEIISSVEREIISDFERFLDDLKSNPQKSLENFVDLLDKVELNQPFISDDLYHKTLYTIGHVYFFNLQDSLSAKIYFDRVLNLDYAEDYKSHISKFYNGEFFLVYDDPVTEDETIEEELIKEEEKLFPETEIPIKDLEKEKEDEIPTFSPIPEKFE